MDWPSQIGLRLNKILKMIIDHVGPLDLVVIRSDVDNKCETLGHAEKTGVSDYKNDNK